MSQPTALTIAGLDPSGGAGIAADLKTFYAHRVYGMSVATLLTVQNTAGVTRVDVLDSSFVIEQLAAVQSDIPPGAAKLGALGSADVVRALAEHFETASLTFPLVIDPVMISKHGAPLMDDDAVTEMQALLSWASLITPNAPEASALSGVQVVDDESAEAAGRVLLNRGAQAVLIKGGHLAEEGDSVDTLVTKTSTTRFSAPRVKTDQSHGTGCTLSAAITARLARGEALETAIQRSKQWLTRALQTAPGLGAGTGPVNHFVKVEHLETAPNTREYTGPFEVPQPAGDT